MSVFVRKCLIMAIPLLFFIVFKITIRYRAETQEAILLEETRVNKRTNWNSSNSNNNNNNNNKNHNDDDYNYNNMNQPDGYDNDDADADDDADAEADADADADANAEEEDLFNNNKNSKNKQDTITINSSTIFWSKNWRHYMICKNWLKAPPRFATRTNFKYKPNVFRSYFSKCRSDYIFLNTGYSKRKNNPQKFISHGFPVLRQPNFTFITADGDLSYPSYIRKGSVNKILQSNKLIRWYTQNYDGSLYHPKLYPIPIGFDLHSNVTENLNDTLWDASGDAEINVKTMLRMRREALRQNPIEQRPKSIYVTAMAYEHRHPDRKIVNDVLDRCQEKQKQQQQQQKKKDGRISNDFISHFHEQQQSPADAANSTNNTAKIIIPRSTTWKRFGEHRYGVSPFGYGLDCYRTWEMLWMGMIPIVRSSSLDTLYRNLPVIILQDYDDLCPEDGGGTETDADFLERAFQNIKQFWPAPDKIFTHQYWIKERYDHPDHKQYWDDLSNRFGLRPTLTRKKENNNNKEKETNNNNLVWLANDDDNENHMIIQDDDDNDNGNDDDNDNDDENQDDDDGDNNDDMNQIDDNIDDEGGEQQS